MPLTPPQSLALWRRVIRSSEAGAELIGERGAADWAAEAWRLLCHWRIDPASERASGEQHDFAAFLLWCREYRDALAANDWIDQAEIARRLPAAEWSAPPRVTFADRGRAFTSGAGAAGSPDSQRHPHRARVAAGAGSRPAPREGSPTRPRSSAPQSPGRARASRQRPPRGSRSSCPGSRSGTARSSARWPLTQAGCPHGTAASLRPRIRGSQPR